MKEYNGFINMDYPDNPYSIYTIVSSNTSDKSIYIGVTHDPKQRAYRHSNNRRYERYSLVPLYIWMNDVIEVQNNKVLFNVIEKSLSKKNAFDKEIKLIQEYKDKGFIVMNISDGGKGNKGGIPWNKGKTGVYTDKQLKVLSECYKGTGMSGKNHSKATKNLISLKNKERKAKGYVSPNRKKVYKYDENSNLLKTYSSLVEASLKENVSSTSIGEWCRNVTKSSNEFIWSYTKFN
jgi:predicted GIY-YIG superfamily endonuclease